MSVKGLDSVFWWRVPPPYPPEVRYDSEWVYAKVRGVWHYVNTGCYAKVE